MKKQLLLLTIPCALVLSAFTVAAVVRPEVFFKKGNKITYQLSSNDTEEKFYCVFNVQSVTVKDGMSTIVVKDQRQYDTRKNQPYAYRLTFYCDSVNWCADALNAIDVDWKKSSNPDEMELISDSLVYPLRMSVGDSLPGASGREVTKWKSGTTERRVFYTKRYVAGKEDVTVGTETVSAFRIESQFRFQKVGDKVQEVTKIYTEWFEPSRGIVKRELKGISAKPFIQTYVLLPATK